MCEEQEHSEHHHSEHKHDKNIVRIIIAAAIFAVGLICKNIDIKTVLFLIAYLIAGYDVIINALKNIIRGKVFDENFLMSIATIGAIGIKEFSEAVFVMIFYQIGEFLQHKAVHKTEHSISNLLNIKAEYANIEENGILVKKSPKEISIDDIIIVKAGEKIPLDGIIIDGQSLLDVSSLTGEALPQSVKKGDNVLSGCINTNGILKIKVTKDYKDSTAAKILELVKNASKNKSKAENFITKFAKIYTPIVVICAIFLVVLPIIFSGIDVFNIWFKRALTFLVISCPCALVISIPLTFFCGIGSASKLGILIKGSNFLEKLSKVEYVVFDKTGTLTKGVFKVAKIKVESDFSEKELLKLAAYAEVYSNHPIANAIKEEFGEEIESKDIEKADEIIGKGIEAIINGKTIVIGNKELIESLGIKIKEEEKEEGTKLYIARNLEYLGYIVINDEIKDNAKATIKKLNNLKIKTIMLSGDKKENAQIVKEVLRIDEYYAELLPNDKTTKLEEILSNKNSDKSVIYAGDGINDAPVLMRSDIGIAMGAIGSDAAIKAADIVITDDNLDKIPAAIDISKRTIKIAKQNIGFAIGIKLIFLLLGSLGFMTMWGAVFADVGVTFIAILNSIRALNR